MQIRRVSQELLSLFDQQCGAGAEALSHADLQVAAAHYAEAAGIATSALWLVSARDQPGWRSRQSGARSYVARLQERIKARVEMTA
jgi:hypothetical protein